MGQLADQLAAEAAARMKRWGKDVERLERELEKSQRNPGGDHMTPKIYKVKTAFCLGRGRDVLEGAELRVPGDLSEADARAKAQAGMIEAVAASSPAPAKEEAKPEAAADPAAATHADPPQPATRGRGRGRGRSK